MPACALPTEAARSSPCPHPHPHPTPPRPPPPRRPATTGNDFSTVYAPLVRDGRMTKFLWEPNSEELVDIVLQVGDL